MCPLPEDVVAGRLERPLRRAARRSGGSGICPAARKNHAVFHESKYSALARNVTLRRTTSGMKKESQKDWWLAASTAGPCVGMFSRPSTFTRNSTKKIGVRTALSTQYVTRPTYPCGLGPAPGAPAVLNCGADSHRDLEVRTVTSETLTAEPFVSGLYFGECPRWHDGRLWYSDFFDHAVFSVSPDGERRVEVDFDGEPAGLGWLPDGRLLINSRLDRAVMRREADGTLVRARRPQALGHLARQRHGGGVQRAGLLPATSASTSTASTTAGRVERHRARRPSSASTPTAPAARPPTTSRSPTAPSSPRTAPRSSSPRASAAG